MATPVVTVLAVIVFASLAAAQSPLGAPAIDGRQDDRYGWAVDYEIGAAAALQVAAVVGFQVAEAATAASPQPPSATAACSESPPGASDRTLANMLDGEPAVPECAPGRGTASTCS